LIVALPIAYGAFGFGTISMSKALTQIIIAVFSDLIW
jgi:hypothetical protein